MSTAVDKKFARRTLLKFGFAEPSAANKIRPPWTDESRIADKCTGCAKCVDTCPEGVLKVGSGGYPEVIFSRNGCSLCGECVKVCDAAVFDAGREAAFTHAVHITSDCLLKANITCQACVDTCDSQALIFDLRVRPAGTLRVDDESCTGCGFCVSSCPVSAIEIANQGVGNA